MKLKLFTAALVSLLVSSGFTSAATPDLSILTMDADFWGKSPQENLNRRSELGFSRDGEAYDSKKRELSLWGKPVHSAKILSDQSATTGLEVTLLKASGDLDDGAFKEARETWFKLIDSEMGVRYNRLTGVNTDQRVTAGLRWEVANTLAVLSTEYSVDNGERVPSALKFILVPKELSREYTANYSKPSGGAMARGGGGASSAVGSSLSGKVVRLDGGQFSKAELKKRPKYFIFYYSASWCPPCRATAPHSVREFKSKIEDNPDVALIHISADRDDGPALQWAKKEKMTWLTVLPGKRNRIVGADYKGGIPRMVLVDASGEKIADAHPGDGFSSFLRQMK